MFLYDGWQDSAGLTGDATIVLDAPVALEVEDGLLAEDRGIKIAIGNDQLVAFARCRHDDLTVWIDNKTTRNHGVPILDATLRHSNHPSGILIGARLQGQ